MCSKTRLSGGASDRRAEQIAKDELDCLEAIEDSELNDRDKCAEVVALLHGTKKLSEIITTLQNTPKEKPPADPPGSDAGGLP